MHSNLEKAKKELILRAYQRGITKPRDFMVLKNKISEEFKLDSLPNYGLTQVYEKMILDGEINPSFAHGSSLKLRTTGASEDEALRKLLRKAKMRTLSGVAVVSVLTKEYGCPGNCLYCPTEKDMPKSYLSNEPAVMRAILADFDPYRQVMIRLEALAKAGHSTDKIELIVMGGSFNALPEYYQYWFLQQCFRACNEFETKKNVKLPNCQIANSKKISQQFNNLTVKQYGGDLQEIKKYLVEQQKINESAKSRIIGLTLETRPDLITESELIKFREMGCTRIEIGAQSIYDEVLKKNRRGHGVESIVEATKLMKDFGFKVSYHMMPGLYGSNLKKDLQMFKDLFSDERFQPDQIKIYPCVVVKGTGLYKLWKEKKYKPYTDKQLLDLICEIKKIIPPYVRISRLIRDTPEESIEAGNKITNLRQVIANRSRLEKWKCQCIRCREIKDKNQESTRSTSSGKASLNRIDYKASDGEETFLELISNDYHLHALLRLRIFGGKAIIREVHTYGEVTDIGKVGSAKQHTGLGKRLIAEAEKIARKEGCKEISIIAGVGARAYYRKLGYKLEDTYMVKSI